MTFTSPTITRSFAGDLELEDQAVPVSVAFHEGLVRLILGGETVGSWPHNEVEFVPDGSSFEIRAEGDSVRFYPYDRTAFTSFVRSSDDEPPTPAEPPHAESTPSPMEAADTPEPGPAPLDPPPLSSGQGRLLLEPDFLDDEDEEPASLLEPPDSPDELFAAGLTGQTTVPVPQFRSGLVHHDPPPVESHSVEDEAPPAEDPVSAPETEAEPPETIPAEPVEDETEITPTEGPTPPAGSVEPPETIPTEPVQNETEATPTGAADPLPAPVEPLEEPQSTVHPDTAIVGKSETQDSAAETSEPTGDERSGRVVPGMALLNRLRDNWSAQPAEDQASGDVAADDAAQEPSGIEPVGQDSDEADSISYQASSPTEAEDSADATPEPPTLESAEEEGAEPETTEPAGLAIPGMALFARIRQAWTEDDAAPAPGQVEEGDNTPRPLDDAENLRQWALVVAGGLVVLAVVGIVAWGVAAVIGGENPVAEEPTPSTEATADTRPVPEPDPTTTAAPTTTVAPENASAAQTFVDQWNTLATRYAYHLSISADRLPISTAPAPTVHLTYGEDGILRLSMAPKGGGSDRDLLLAMGMAVAWGDPGLSPEGRKDVLSALGVDVEDPHVADIGGELTRGEVTYRAVMENDVLRFEVVPERT